MPKIKDRGDRYYATGVGVRVVKPADAVEKKSKAGNNKNNTGRTTKKGVK